ncbi:MAG TPA: DUF1788 domain-containing protein [Clostridiaceae bacterium]|nr:DUF1788 domain-containing protein [Clostridiaceae bacterium]
MKTIFERLDAIIPEIQKKSFRENRGLGNEIGYYIFDYEPKYELVVRDYVKFVKEKVNGVDSGFKIKEFDLYEVILEILGSKGYLKKNMEMEKSKGSKKVFEATKKALRLTDKNDLIIRYIKENTAKGDIVFLTGVGKAWPIIRSHTILNNLHSAIDEVPVVMFFPGTYDGLELVLLDEIKDDNYYRAFKLIER